jgi:hypothetical protein
MVSNRSNGDRKNAKMILTQISDFIIAQETNPERRRIMNTFNLQHLARQNQQSAERNASNMRLWMQAKAGQPTVWTQAIEKAALSLIKAGEALNALAQRKTVLNS